MGDHTKATFNASDYLDFLKGSKDIGTLGGIYSDYWANDVTGFSTFTDTYMIHYDEDYDFPFNAVVVQGTEGTSHQDYLLGGTEAGNF